MFNSRPALTFVFPAQRNLRFATISRLFLGSPEQLPLWYATFPLPFQIQC